jgi:hypothetical protein
MTNGVFFSFSRDCLDRISSRVNICRGLLGRKCFDDAIVPLPDPSGLFATSQASSGKPCPGRGHLFGDTECEFKWNRPIPVSMIS